MSQNEFDCFAKSYDTTLINSLPKIAVEDEYFSEYKVSYIAKKIQVEPIKILDFGCGIGRSLPWLEKYFASAELWGYDPSELSLERAQVVSPKAKLVNQLDKLSAEKFDIILAANVFHHIPKSEQLFALEQCRQLLAKSGVMYIFEHNPNNPVTRWVFERCVFDIDAEMVLPCDALYMGEVSGFRKIDLEYTLFFPRPLRMLRFLERWISKIPLGAQYCVRLGS